MNFAQIRAILKNKDSHVNIDSTKKGNITNMEWPLKYKTTRATVPKKNF
jgi:hypothetical protein